MLPLPWLRVSFRSRRGVWLSWLNEGRMRIRVILGVVELLVWILVVVVRVLVRKRRLNVSALLSHEGQPRKVYET